MADLAVMRCRGEGGGAMAASQPIQVPIGDVEIEVARSTAEMIEKTVARSDRREVEFRLKLLASVGIITVGVADRASLKGCLRSPHRRQVTVGHVPRRSARRTDPSATAYFEGDRRGPHSDGRVARYLARTGLVLDDNSDLPGTLSSAQIGSLV